MVHIFRPGYSILSILFLLLASGAAPASIYSTLAPGASTGNSVTVSPHHSDPGHPGSPNTHYFAETGDAHHFAWGSFTPTTPGTLTVYYDFRDEGLYDNMITPDQRLAAISALDAWSAATGGRLVFSLNTSAPMSQIINIGTGDLAALGYASGPGGVLALGGGSFNHSGGHTITSGIAWQDYKENWDATIGNGDPAGTFDYFTVVAQEIGHALGLGHDPSSPLMSGVYSGEQTALSASDIEHITSIYGIAAVPLPAGVWLLGSGLAWLWFALHRRRKAVTRPAPDGLVAA